jgi:methyl-accepting chemotaxis protein
MQRISAETQNFASAAEETAGTSNQMSELAAQLRQTLLEMRA